MKNFFTKFLAWLKDTFTNYQGPDEVYGIYLEQEYQRQLKKGADRGIQK